MKIAVRGGHCVASSGASGIISELYEDRILYPYIISELTRLSNTVLDVTSCASNEENDLAYGVNRANSWGADLFMSIHFNSCETPNTGSGSEVLCCTGSVKGAEYAQHILNGLVSVGFANRGIIKNTYYELRNTNMPAVIIEICFVNSEKDVALYRKLGPVVVAKAIANSILNIPVEAVTTPVVAPTPVIVSTPYVNVSGNVSLLQSSLNKAFRFNLSVDNSFGPLTSAALNRVYAKRGDRNEFVRFIQTMLIQKGYSLGSCGADGSFGPVTQAVLIGYQKKSGLTPDGLAGPLTVKKLLGI